MVLHWLAWWYWLQFLERNNHICCLFTIDNRRLLKQTELHTAWYSTDWLDGTDCSSLNGKLHLYYFFSLLLKWTELHTSLHSNVLDQNGIAMIVSLMVILITVHIMCTSVLLTNLPSSGHTSENVFIHIRGQNALDHKRQSWLVCFITHGFSSREWAWRRK